DQGRIVADGSAEEVVHKYFVTAAGASAVRLWTDPATALGVEGFKLRAVVLMDGVAPAMVAQVDEPHELVIRYATQRFDMRFRFVAAFNSQGVCAFLALQLCEILHAQLGTFEVRI